MNILLVDDHKILFDGVSNRLKRILPNSICYYSDGKAIEAFILKYEIDIIICDLNFDSRPYDGFELLSKALLIKPQIKAIAFTSYNSYRILKKVKSTGFNSYLLKSVSEEEFSKTIKGVIQHGDFISETMSKIYKKRKCTMKGVFSDSLYGLSSLSKQEINLILECKETTDRHYLGKKFNVSPRTIDSYFQRIKEKLSLQDRKEVQHFGIEFKEELFKQLELY